MSEQFALCSSTLPPRNPAEFCGLPVMVEDTSRVIRRLHQHLQLLLLERATLVKRIRLLRHTLAGLADIFGPDILGEEVKRLLSQDTNLSQRRERAKRNG